MPDLYSDSHRQLQDQHQTRALADKLEQLIVHAEFTEQDAQFIAGREFFFLSSVGPTGHPTVSYKGGAKGFVAVVDNELVFPCYDGNGMFLSMGNIASDPRVGLLFIDFETPRRLRVQGRARLDTGEGMARYPGALSLIRIAPEQIFVNCARYIHRHLKLETSVHVPDANGCAPLARWKKIDALQDALPPADQARVLEEGTIDFAEAQADADAGRG